MPGVGSPCRHVQRRGGGLACGCVWRRCRASLRSTAGRMRNCQAHMHASWADHLHHSQGGRRPLGPAATACQLRIHSPRAPTHASTQAEGSVHAGRCGLSSADDGSHRASLRCAHRERRWHSQPSARRRMTSPLASQQPMAAPQGQGRSPCVFSSAVGTSASGLTRQSNCGSLTREATGMSSQYGGRD